VILTTLRLSTLSTGGVVAAGGPKASLATPPRVCVCVYICGQYHRGQSGLEVLVGIPDDQYMVQPGVPHNPRLSPGSEGMHKAFPLLPKKNWLIGTVVNRDCGQSQRGQYQRGQYHRSQYYHGQYECGQTGPTRKSS